MPTFSSCSAALLLLLAASQVIAADLPANLPKHKPGLWTMASQVGDRKSPASQICLDPSIEATMYKMSSAMGSSLCQKMDIQVHGNKVVSDSVCTMPAMLGGKATNISGHAETTFDGDTAFHTESVAHYEPAFMGKTERVTVQNGHWVSACTAGMKPGDLISPNGKIVNLSQLMPH
ncbi:DUF3617 domain-containing protein [Dyella tabacisoli]|uniref:DUF3617 family protein n=1 Tax=Dyella tabacisoli TaxID=2282381 RepID=A0A369UKQ9_9GAMM|nr:DUF3617 family protein [Dyella tabacisoli]RDD80180.1 DUF3617 family protein [Dyella tabacisoli]